MRVSVLLLIFFVSCVLSQRTTWDGEWAVHVASGVDTQFLNNLGFTVVKKIGNLEDAYVIRHAQLTTQHPSHQIEAAHATLQTHSHVMFVDKLHKKHMAKKGLLPFADPLYLDQWHLNNTGQEGGTPGQDINIYGAWDMGYSGRGVRIAIVDDGYQYAHPDLAPGYQAESSYNFNNANFDPAPVEPYDAHGTSAAGVALAANNSACGVGAAFAAQGSGIRLIAAMFSDADTAAALNFRNDVNDIYSNSWGPIDDGETLEAPGYFTLAALENGIKKGRKGRGSIFVWAAGNGLANNDNCNYDGFANHRATIAVGAIDNNGKQSWYSEPCSAMLVTAPSSGVSAGITTTDLLGEAGYDPSDCTAKFGGTSSACPLAAGVIALMLEANPSLNWRDVQHILLSTAEKNDPEDSDWTENGAGYHINHKYGFGRVNALAAVKACKNFDDLNSVKIDTYSKVLVNSTIPDNEPYFGVNKSVEVKSDLVVEHVEVTVNIPNFFSAGDLVVILTSPSGTKSVLAEQHGSGDAIFLTLPAFPEASYICGPAYFGAPLTTEPISGQIAIPQPSSFACNNNITNCADLEGKIVMVDFSPVCNFTQQVYNVQECGAILVLVSNRFVGPPTYLPNDDPAFNITIPATMIPFEAGILIKDEMEYSGEVSVQAGIQHYRANLSYDGWTFSTVRNWGESSHGTWTLQVFDTLAGAEATFASYDLVIYGHLNPYKLPYWIAGIIAAFVVAVIIVISTILYFRNRNSQGGYKHVP